MARRVRRNGSAAPVSAEGAVRLLARAAPHPAPGLEEIPIARSLGRIAARPVRARRTLPAVDLALMDGYAIRAPRGGEPRDRTVVGRSVPGQARSALPRIDATTAVEVVTGSPLPAGADTVLRLEEARRSSGTVRPLETPRPGQHIARRGEDFHSGDLVLAAGARVRPWHIAAGIALAIHQLAVLPTVRVGVLSTGSELVEAGPTPPRGKVSNSTKPLLLASLEERGLEPLDLGTVPDDLAAIEAAIRRGQGRCDVLVTTGGSSVGASDLVRPAIGRIPGARFVFRSVRVRPGSQSAAAIVRGKPVLILSGLPVAALAGMVTVLEPYLAATTQPGPRPREQVPARLRTAIPHQPGIRELVRVRLQRREGAWHAEMVDRRGSSRLSSLTASDGFIELREDRAGYRAGCRVRVSRW